MHIKFLATAAITASMLAIPAPALATIDPLGTNPALDQQCDDQLNPSDNSGFTTYAIVTGQSGQHDVVTDIGSPSTVGVGASTTVIGNFHGAHVNGQSVNIHAYGDQVTSFAGGANIIQPIRTDTIVTLTAGCHVHKPVNPNSPNDGNDPLHDGYHMPPGLQLNPVTTDVIVSTTYGTRISGHINGPWVDPNISVYGGEFVICISPGKVPGSWRNANGYANQLGVCSRPWHDSLGLSVSVSIPAT